MKRLMLFTLLTVMMSISPCEAFFDKYGMSVSAGGLSDHAVGHTDSDHDFYWGSLGFFGRHNLTPKWYGDLEGDIGYLSWIGSNEEKSDHVVSIETRLMIMRKLFTHLHLGLGGGFCLLADSNGHPGLGDSGFYGLITTRVRIPFYTSDNKHEWGLDIGTDHISGVTDEDSGRNVIKGRVYFTF